jgi:hypothetical protein
MELTIVDNFKDVKRIRISHNKGTCNISWPVGTDIESKDRKNKIHDSITRCFQHDDDFQKENIVLKTNVQLDRLDKLQYCDLRWEAIDLADEEVDV